MRADHASARLARAVKAAPGELLGGTVSVASSRAIWSSLGVVMPVVAQPAGTGGKKRRKKRRKGQSIDGQAGGGGGGGDRTANARVYLASWPRPDQVGREKAEHGTRATKDPADRAHQVRSAADGNLLASADGLGRDGATPRRYPHSHFNGRGVAIDSQFDELHERLRWIEREIGDVPGMSIASASSNQREAVRGVALKRSAEGRRS